MDIMVFVYLVAGLVLLVAGAEIFVRGASRLAALLGISPLVVGLTVVAYGTSLPELAVSLQAVLAGNSNISLGNAVGSNIANVLLILGLSAVVAPLVVSQQLVRLDVPIMIGISILLFFYGLGGQIGRVEGLVLFAGVVAYTVFLVYQSRKETKEIQSEYAQEFGEAKPASSAQTWAMIVGFIFGGIGLLVLGANWLVDSAVTIATAFGVSDLVIGLTIIAVGTSLPELATSVVASYRGERDISVGNVVGSNIFNILMVLGASAALSPIGLEVSSQALWFDILVMIGVALTCLPIFFSGEISRFEGGLFIAHYAFYVTYLILGSNPASAETLNTFLMVMGMVLPLTIIYLIVNTVRLSMGHMKA
jgi:cation:H+ antiporter